MKRDKYVCLRLTAEEYELIAKGKEIERQRRGYRVVLSFSDYVMGLVNKDTDRVKKRLEKGLK